MRGLAPKPAQAGLMQIKKFIDKHGVLAPASNIRHAVRHLPADAQHSVLFHSLLEMAEDLESVLREAHKRQRLP